MQERIFSIFTTSSGKPFFFASSKGKEARTRNTGSRGSQLNDIFSSPSRWKFHKFSICCTNDDFNSFPHLPHRASLCMQHFYWSAHDESRMKIQFEYNFFVPWKSITPPLNSTFCLWQLSLLSSLLPKWQALEHRQRSEKMEKICEICQAENHVKHLFPSTTFAAAFLSSWRNNEDDKLKF